MKKNRVQEKTVQNFLREFINNLNNLSIMSRDQAHTKKERKKDPKAVCARHEFGNDVETCIVNTVRSLTYNDYIETCADKKYKQGDMYIFRKDVKGIPLYVKLQNTRTGVSLVKSFHEWRD